MFTEDQLLPISALQHLLFCERQCALIHLEGLWAENRLTVEGQQLHQRAHDETRGDQRPGVRISRGLNLCSYELGLVGKADVVEFHDDGRVVPVEYKRGRPKKDGSDVVQLCAQSLCLEEMLGVTVAEGALFYGRVRRRKQVAIDESLRNRTKGTIKRLHEMILSRVTPSAKYEKKCDRCSLKDLCLPTALKPRATAARYLARVVAGEVGVEWDGIDLET